MQNGELYDKELGRIVVKVNPRARNIILRARPDAIYVTVPCGVSEQEVINVVDKYRLKLSKDMKKVERKKIDLSYRIETDYFKLSLVGGNQDKFLAHSELGNMQIICPSTANFDDEDLQLWLQKVVIEALRRNAKIILPPRIYQLSNQFGLPYDSIKINSSKGRWGSCSGRKAINLSCYLMLLPRHLIDYVLLHELSHTKEMNHGDGFWLLLNKLTDGKALILRTELRKYKAELL